MNNEQGIVYVLTNPVMDGLVKIGKTSRDEVQTRLNELYSTGVPVPFECAYAARVEDYSKVERAFHQAFGPYRINSKREFFKIEADQAIALLRLMALEDVTPSIIEEATKVDSETQKSSKKVIRRPNQNFLEMGLKIGDTITFSQGDETAVIASGRKVLFRGEEVSLTYVTKTLLNDGAYDVAPGGYWYYGDRSLRDIYNETYS
ncbi:GIY-YIG nuclease family protein [Rubritalea tangerina]|uniref:GIY-YIG nuclease family protein n=1 Tax=Rubritalea tangerina TaxID=430798 RepID=A0ABW4Z700_9BACT